MAHNLDYLPLFNINRFHFIWIHRDTLAAMRIKTICKELSGYSL